MLVNERRRNIKKINKKITIWFEDFSYKTTQLNHNKPD